jgi:hypothetical protein
MFSLHQIELAAEGLRLLRSRIRKKLGLTADLAGNKIVYLSRADGPDSKSVRMIENEALLVEHMVAEFGRDNVIVFKGTGMPVSEQYAVFASAAVVLAPHGAGLANLVATAAGTAFIMFPMRPHVDNTFNHMGAALDFDCYMIPSISSYYYGTYGEMTLDKVHIVMMLLRKTYYSRMNVKATLPPVAFEARVAASNVHTPEPNPGLTARYAAERSNNFKSSKHREGYKVQETKSFAKHMEHEKRRNVSKEGKNVFQDFW